MSAEFGIEFTDPNFWTKLVDRGREVLTRAFGYSAIEAWGNVRENAPVDHGRLAGSWELEMIDDETARLYTAVSYAEAVSTGTDPHTITPVSASVLAFEVSGQMIFARRVEHPGTAGNPYVEESIEAARRRGSEFVDRALRELGSI